MAADGLATGGARTSIVCVYRVLAEYSGLSTRALYIDVDSMILCLLSAGCFMYRTKPSYQV